VQRFSKIWRLFSSVIDHQTLWSLSWKEKYFALAQQLPNIGEFMPLDWILALNTCSIAVCSNSFWNAIMINPPPNSRHFFVHLCWCWNLHWGGDVNKLTSGESRLKSNFVGSRLMHLFPTFSLRHEYIIRSRSLCLLTTAKRLKHVAMWTRHNE
jgi:hypothetical protein